MRIRLDSDPLRRTSWRGHALRFIVGGVVTVATGLVGTAAGPVVGGLFLAFPAIFPVGVAMIERLENRAAGPDARGHRARRAVLADAAGTSLGALGLTTFAVVGWLAGRHAPMAAALAMAGGAWAVFSLTAWYLDRRWRRRKVRN